MTRYSTEPTRYVKGFLSWQEICLANIKKKYWILLLLQD